MKQLIIVESPHKAKTIQKYLGNDATVMASKGHVCDLPPKSLGIDVDNGFVPQYVVPHEKEEIVKRLSAAAEKFSVVYLATDPDREGEAISWHLKNQLGIKGDAVRIEFNEISAKAVKEAMGHPRSINMNLVNSQQARRILDRLVGYKISPILSQRIKSGSSAGRVQSAALKMIVDREKEIRAFVPEEYWSIAAMLAKADMPRTKSNLFKAVLNDYKGEKIKVDNEALATEITDLMTSASYTVDDVKKGTAVSKPAPPFTTSTLQQEASHKLNMTSDRSMRIAQQLYEGTEIAGEGQDALITYIRTDSVRVSPEFGAVALDYVKHHFGKEYAPSMQNVYKTSDAAQDAHEAIRPISLERTPQSLEGKIERDQLRLYKLIYERFLASQMTNAVFNVMNVHIIGKTSAADIGFTVRGRSVKFKGYTAVYTATSDKEEDSDEMSTLPDIGKGEKLEYVDTVKEQKFTKPPSRYTDATLVKAMEENGVGRPSTYASIISVIALREYTEKQGKTIAATQLGETVCEYLEKNFSDIMNLEFTARLEHALDKIATGEQDWNILISKYYPRLMASVQRAGASGGVMRAAAEMTDIVCETCGAKMVIRDGKYGKFYGCSNYPKCNNKMPINEKVGVCPKCGGDLQKRVSKGGKVFYGCSKYPNCDFVVWDLPASHLCPKCNSLMKVTTRDYEKAYVCTNKDCKFVEHVSDNGEK